MRSTNPFSGRKAPFTVSLLAAALAAGTYQSVLAQTVPVLDDEIIVTARKRAETLETAPVAITVLGSRQLEQYNITRMEDMSSLAGGGVLISKNGVSPAISIRGVSSDSTNAGFDQSVGIIIDGVFYDRSRWTQQGFFDTAQVEVLKGPQSLYFGKSTVAGAIVLTTASPGDEFEGYVTAGREFDTKGWYGEGVVSGPVSDTLGARLALRAAKSDGWLKNDAPEIATNEFGAEEEYNGRLTLKWDPSENVAVNFKVQAAHNEDDGPATRAQLYNCRGPAQGGRAFTGIPTDLQGPPYFAAYPIVDYDNCKLDDHITVYPGPPGLEFAQRPEGKTDAVLSSLKVDWNLGSWTLTSVTGWNDYTVDDETGYVSSQGLISAKEQESNTAFSQELRALSDFKGPLNVLVGVNYQETEFKFRNASQIILAIPYKTGYLPGGFSLGATPQAGLTIDDFLFDSEEVKGFEVGFKTLLANDRLSVDVVAYSYEFSDLQVNLYVPVTASFVVGNAGDATTQGVETNFRWQATDQLQLRASASYNEGEYSSSYITQCYTLQRARAGCDPITNTQDLDGKALPRAPKYTFGVGGQFMVPLDFGNLSLAADANWSDHYQIETTNSPYLVQDSYWRVDASVALESCDGHWRAMLIGRNLTDETITSFGATRGFTNDQLAELMPLRQVSAELTYKF
ncbi:MAG: TonB-dependent receptor [Gammaproteobacteria bacterium]|nr:TonB-dependent receptor [Gammaproteobacteria bacterium]